MRQYQNHVIDPTFFYDAVENFAFDFDIYIQQNDDILDDYGNSKLSYKQDVIRGSLQSDGVRLRQSKDGNTNEMKYRFYCMSKYRINIGDIIEYKGNYLRVNFVQDYDEYGVRSAELAMIKLTAYRDFADYLKYQKGVKLV